ncbi:MAG TPA: efflux RND transporter periplasmic adaptor subunit [Bryobacteraceae bacterium]|nr:efflux RND transporter periplasmic adaptor subunit [Bryobacteraceae bacterium]
MLKAQVCIALACLVSLAGCSGSKDTGAEEAPTTPVSVATAKLQPITHSITAEAVLYPINQATIVPKISAPVQKFFVNRGDHVRAGQVLATLENRDLLAAVQESKGLYEQAQAAYQTTSTATVADNFTKAKTDMIFAEENLDAAKKLYESREALFREGALARKLVEDSKVALVQAQSQYDTAKQFFDSFQRVGRPQQLRSAQGQLQAAKAHYQNAEAQVSYTEIRSPISGLVSDRPLHVGEMASSGSALVSIVDISKVVARSNIPVHEASSIQVGRPATITGGGAELHGKVIVVSPTVDASTTTVEVWVEAANPGEKMKPGVTVQVSIDAEHIDNAVIVPAAALLSTDEGGDKVMVAGKDSMAHERPVTVGVREKDQVQILKGVAAGEQVIVDGALGLDDKAKIEVSKKSETERGAGGKEEGTNE